MSVNTQFTFGRETLRKVYNDQALPMLSWGLPFPEASKTNIERLKCTRVYILVSRSLANKTTALQRLCKALGHSIVAIRIGIGAHTPISEVIEVISDARRIGNVDCFMTLGGGSVTDAAKLVRFALANNAYTETDINTLWGGHSHNPSRRDDIIAPTVSLIHIPTTLSGGEYQHIAGATETTSKAKRTFEPYVNPTLVIQDPELTLDTPDRLWLSSGIRAVDHCIETLCSLHSNSKGDEEAKTGLSKLIPGLLRCKHDPTDLEARHLCQMGVIEAMSAVSSGVPLGASHAIGHQLGPFGVGHGETSCILLPAVCKYNASKGANSDRQNIVRQLLLSLPEVQDLLQSKSGRDPDLGDILDAVITELGMPRTLKEVNIGVESLDQLAENSLHDIWIKTNAVPMTKKEQVMEILQMILQ